MLFLAADLPDGHVRLTPDLTDKVGEIANVFPLGKGNGLAMLVVEVDAVHEFPVDVELDMVGGCVANTDRGGVLVTREMIQCELGQVGRSIDAEHQG